ncbi:MAG: lysophospholipid acyltransferase family protein [Balneolaceae bacterium]
MKIIVEGKIPKPPFFFVSNHLSYVDVFILSATIKCLFVAKDEMKRWPIFGTIVSTVGMIFVNREKRSDVKRVNGEISKKISQYNGVTLFPESTTSPGYEILPFKSSLLDYPAKHHIPVYNASITYTTPETEQEAYKAISWWGDVPFINHFMNLLTVKNFTGTLIINEEPIVNENRKILADQLHHSISNTFKPVVEKSVFLERHGDIYN